MMILPEKKEELLINTDHKKTIVTCFLGVRDHLGIQAYKHKWDS